jgi:hypothetical protein
MDRLTATRRIKRTQRIALVLLLLGGIVAYIDCAFR